MRRHTSRISLTVAAVLAAVLALPGWALGAQPAAPTDTATQISRIESKLDQLREDRIAAQQAVAAAQQQYDDAVATLSAAQISAEQTQSDLAEAKAALEEATNGLASAARAQYRDASASLKWLSPFVSSNGLQQALEDATAYHQYGSASARTVDAHAQATQRVEVAAKRATEAVEVNKTAATKFEQAASQAAQALTDAAAAEQAATAERDALVAQLARLKAEDEAAERARQDEADRQAGLANPARPAAATGTQSGASGPSAQPAPTQAPVQPTQPTAAPTQPPTPTTPPAPPQPPQPAGPDGPVITGYNDANVPQQYRSWVLKAGSVCSGVPPAIIAAQIQTESSWNPNAVSSMGAQGLTQFMPGTWAAWGQDDDGNGQISPFDPGDAIMAQGRYMCALYAQMSRYLDQGRVTGDNLDLALASYNVGAYATLNRGGITPGGGAERYVNKIRTLAASRYM